MENKESSASDIFNKYAAVYQEKFMDVGVYAGSFDVFCNALLREGAEVLEIGCGPGNITAYLLQKRPDLRITGIDVADKMLELAVKNNPAATFLPMDARDISKLGIGFHGILCGFCLPYLSQEEAIAMIGDAAGLLGASGVIYLSTMEGEYSRSGVTSNSYGDRIFMYYHQEDYLVQALLDHGFRIIKTFRYDQGPPEGEPASDLVIIAVKSK